jgi:DNA-binding MarR family transcriptional regulator
MSCAEDTPTVTRTAELASSLPMSLLRLSRQLRSESSERSDRGVSLTQVATLATLDLHGPLTPRELADHEKVQPASMTRILAGLEERDLIARTPHASDGRQYMVALTESATDLLREDRRCRDSWLPLRLAELTQEEADVLRAAAQLLDRITAHAPDLRGPADP